MDKILSGLANVFMPKAAETTATGAQEAPELNMTGTNPAPSTTAQADPAQQEAARTAMTQISAPVQAQDPSAPVTAQVPQQLKLSEQLAKQAEEVAKKAQETIDNLKQQFVAAIAQEQAVAPAAPAQAVSPQGVPVQQAPLANPLEAQSATAGPAEEISPAELEQMSALLASIMGGAQEAPMTAAPVATAPATAAPAAAQATQAPVVPPAPAAATVA